MDAAKEWLSGLRAENTKEKDLTVLLDFPNTPASHHQRYVLND